MRWAIFLPMPGARVRVLTSSVKMASASWEGVVVDKMDRAALGPTPETEVSCKNSRFSSLVPKPYSSMPSSRTDRWVYKVAGFPGWRPLRVKLVVLQA